MDASLSSVSRLCRATTWLRKLITPFISLLELVLLPSFSVQLCIDTDDTMAAASQSGPSGSGETGCRYDFAPLLQLGAGENSNVLYRADGVCAETHHDNKAILKTLLDMDLLQDRLVKGPQGDPDEAGKLRASKILAQITAYSINQPKSQVEGTTTDVA